MKEKIMTEQAQVQEQIAKTLSISAVVKETGIVNIYVDSSQFDVVEVDVANSSVTVGDEIVGPDHDTANDILTIVLKPGFGKFQLFMNRFLGKLEVKNESGKPYDTSLSGSIVTYVEAVSDPVPVKAPVGKSSKSGCKSVNMRDLL